MKWKYLSRCKLHERLSNHCCWRREYVLRLRSLSLVHDWHKRSAERLLFKMVHILKKRNRKLSHQIILRGSKYMEKPLRDWTPVYIHIYEHFRAIIWMYIIYVALCIWIFVYEYFPGVLPFKNFIPVNSSFTEHIVIEFISIISAILKLPGEPWIKSCYSSGCPEIRESLDL